jgi:hypothetical protein
MISERYFSLSYRGMIVTRKRDITIYKELCKIKQLIHVTLRNKRKTSNRSQCSRLVVPVVAVTFVGNYNC